MKLRAELNLVVERADPPLVRRQQPDQELLGGVLSRSRSSRHAAARVEHHDDGDRLDLVVEEDDRLRLVVVEDLEVVLHQVGHEALLRVDDRGEERDDLGAGP